LHTGPPIKLHILEISFFMRNVRTRLPFRYGRATLVSVPILHARMVVRAETGETGIGLSADILPPKWFDKSPDKDYHQNVADLISAARVGAKHYLEIGSRGHSPFDLWRSAYEPIYRECAGRGLNGLTSGFGSSLMERALIDAAGRVVGCSFSEMLAGGWLGFDPSSLHPELSGWSPPPDFWFPRESIAVRHTVGLSDPIFESDIPPAERLDDGLPQSVESWMTSAGVHYLKVKVSGDVDSNRDRLRRIARLLEDRPHVRLCLDGNENYRTADEFFQWAETIIADEHLRGLWPRVLYVEQPLERSVALSAPVWDALRGLGVDWPLIIDESDEDLGTFRQAVELGYEGISAKNCKGVFKALCNRLLAEHFSRQRGGQFFITAEDLMNLPVVPLQQDLCTLSVLGVEHAERNGHHYCRGLSHVSEAELRACLQVHFALYEPWRDTARLRIRDGRISLTSLRVTGFGVGVEADFAAMTPLEDWDFASLGVVE